MADIPKPLQSLLNNPLVKAALFKQLRKIVQDNNIKLLTISFDDKGEIHIEAYQKDVHIMPSEDYARMINKLFNPENKIE